MAIFVGALMSRVIVLLRPCSQYVLHFTPHVPLFDSWRSLKSLSSNCDALLEIIHIIDYGVRVLCMLSSGAVCIFSRTDRSWARLYRLYCLVHPSHRRPRTENNAHDAVGSVASMTAVCLQQWEVLPCVVRDEVKLIPTHGQHG